MQISMFAASVPVFDNMLGNLSHLLDKAGSDAEARGFDPRALTQFRLAPDMHPFAVQVMIACDIVDNDVSRLIGAQPPNFAQAGDATFSLLQARIRHTREFLATVRPERLDGTEEKTIRFETTDIASPQGGGNAHTMKGLDYLLRWIIPHFFFHVTTAYAILRHNGVSLGKADYLFGARAERAASI
jgi:uncharacterized protein